MPVVVISPSKAKPKKVCQYIMRADKTRDELKFACCSEPDSFYKDFQMIQDGYRSCQKSSNRKYYHLKLSWATEDKVTPEQAYEMAQRFCEETNIKGCQYAGSIHIDTQTIHAHIVINNVRIEDNEYGKAGYSYQATKNSREQMMEKANEIAKEYGLIRSVIDDKKEAKERYSRGEIELYKKGDLPWKEKLRMELMSARDISLSYPEWKEHLKEKYGIRVVENQKGKIRYLTKDMEDEEKGCPARRLGNEFEKEELERYFKEKGKIRER